MRIEEALERYLVQLQADGRSPITLGQYRRGVLLLARWAAEAGESGEVEELGHEDLARFLCAPVARLRRDGHPKKPSSMNVLRGVLKTFFGYVHRAAYVREDPSRLIRMAVCGRPQPKALSEGESQRLMAVMAAGEGRAAQRDYALFWTLLGTGIRVGSALALEVGDVELEEGRLLLREMKGGREERVRLGPEVREHLRGYLAGRRAGPVFPAKHGGRLDRRTVQVRLAVWAEKAGIGRVVTPHGLRHTFATRLYAETRDILLVREALCHRSLGSTVVYTQCLASSPLRPSFWRGVRDGEGRAVERHVQGSPDPELPGQS